MLRQEHSVASDIRYLFNLLHLFEGGREEFLHAEAERSSERPRVSPKVS